MKGKAIVWLAAGVLVLMLALLLDRSPARVSSRQLHKPLSASPLSISSRAYPQARPSSSADMTGRTGMGGMSGMGGFAGMEGMGGIAGMVGRIIRSATADSSSAMSDAHAGSGAAGMGGMSGMSGNDASTVSSAPETASPWSNSHGARVRLIGGDADFSASGGKAHIGIQIQLSSGWKTYWRLPGETGTPPAFDWSGSRNLARADVLWPAPDLYRQKYGSSIGYKHEVILPVSITARDSSRPVELHLTFDYGICSDICVPVRAKLELTVRPHQRGMKKLLDKWLTMVPEQVAAPGRGQNGFSIDRVRYVADARLPRLIILARTPASIKRAELYGIAANDRNLPLPAVRRMNRSRWRFIIALDPASGPEHLLRSGLELVLVGHYRNGRKAGVRARLDNLVEN